jgi:predicted RNA-binding Zn-ribbon protein involved in translation (DUF1610 family)
MSEPDELSANHVKAMDCPSCGGGIELQAAGYSTYFVCQYCGSELDLLSDDVRLIAEHAEAAEALYIPLGTRGTLRGVEWVTIGNLKKTDGWEEWDEFLLFNPYHGYRWLVFTKDGWSFGTPILAQPERLPGGSYLYDGAGMKICYYFADSTTQSALGEFYWRAQRGDVVRSASYVGGGRMLSCEDAGSEYNWTLEEWIASSEVARAFGIQDTGQYPEIGDTPLPHQPNPHAGKAVNRGLIATVFFLLGILGATMLSYGGETRTKEYSAKVDTPNRSVSLGQFTIEDRPKPFTIATRGSPGDNNWMDVEYTLANVATGDEIIANQPIEYYFGRDWKEDDRSGTLKIASVPAGTYELTADITLPEDENPARLARSNASWDAQARPVAISASSNGVFSSNIVLLFLALFSPALWVWFKSASFEGARSAGYDGEDDDD